MRGLFRSRLFKLLFTAALLGVLVVVGSNLYVIARGGGMHKKIADVEPAQTAIVLGAQAFPGGGMSGMLRDRVDQGAALYKSGKVKKVIVSGDNRERHYDEVDTMRLAMLERGVPASAIFTDYAGFNTWASMVRARKVFKVKTAVVVTQGFHMRRALYLAKAAGLKASGLTSDLHRYGRFESKSQRRELLARIKAAKDGTFKTGVLLGPIHRISGDGRGSWDKRSPAADTQRR